MEVTSPKDIETILASIDWHHAFIRELHFVSPSYYDLVGHCTVAPDSRPDVFALIFTGDPRCRHLELHLSEVESVAILTGTDIEPSGVVNKGSIKLRLSPAGTAEIVARGLAIRQLGDDGAGWHLRYGTTNPFSESGDRAD